MYYVKRTRNSSSNGCQLFHNKAMYHLNIIFIAFLRVAIAAVCAWFVGSWLGKPIEVVALVLGVFLFWHIFSGRWLALQLLSDAKSRRSVSILPLTYEDIRLHTAIRKHDEELDQREIIRASSAALPDGVIVIDQSDKVLLANQKAEEYLGIRESDDVGQRITNIVRFPRFLSFVEETRNDLSGYIGSIELNSPFQESVRLRLSCRHFGEHLRMLIIHDVTDFHRVNKVRQDFIGNASHELRTPLTVVRGYLEEMQDDEEMPLFWKGPIAAIEKQTLRMQNIIEDMLTLSKLESKTRLADKEMVNLAVLAQQVKVDLTQVFHGSHTIIDDVPTNLYIRGEESELYSIFSNLVKNACLYSPEGSKVIIQSSQQADEFQISVEDQGLGIPQTSIDRLTERFYRVDDGRSRDKGGTGLGLAIVKHALSRHEGYLSIESQIDVGSQFICHFPESRITLTE